MSTFMQRVTHGVKRGRFDLRSRAAIGLFASIAALTLVAMLYLMLVSWTAAKGRDIEQLQAELIRLEKENQQLEAKIAEEGAVYRLRTRAAALGFSPAEQVEFFSPTD